MAAHSDPEGTAPIHASCIAVEGRGLLILGPSGCGKSALSLSLMALGATLVADDRTCLADRDGALWASAPDTLHGRIEARGLGILLADAAPATVVAAVDLGREETERLPYPRSRAFLGHTLPLHYRVDAPHFAPALAQYLRAGLWSVA